MQNGINSMTTRNVLNLATTKVILLRKYMNIIIAKVRYHRAPDVGTGLFCGLIELNFIQKSALKSFIHILLQIGGGYHDAVKIFHLLQDDILQRVLHFVNGILCPILSFANDGICLIK